MERFINETYKNIMQYQLITYYFFDVVFQ